MSIWTQATFNKGASSPYLASRFIATEGPDNGFYLAGCHRPDPNDTGSIGYLSADGDSLDSKQVNYGQGQCGVIGLTSTSDSGEATIFGKNNLSGDINTYHFKYLK